MKRPIEIGIVALLIVLAFLSGISVSWFSEHATTFVSVSTSTVETTYTQVIISTSQSKNAISTQGFSLCSSSCGYPSPFLEGYVYVNATVPPSSLLLFVNGSYQRTNDITGALVILYKATLDNQSVPIVAGRHYLITLIATFEDSTAYNLSLVCQAS